ncbi:hypothetical protein [Pseudosulfitobacter pseudonitzschiae]|uniref:hypothetical protein n=1 Tax=Pseudosulfitobacter pseudonitzschiae TaxID=1402135 RepID=UPI003B801BE7
MNSSTPKRRLPRLVGGFSVNFCRNPHCDRFGFLPHPFSIRGRRGGDQDHGRVVGSGEDRSFRCPACDGFNIIKSNTAIAEEYSRLSRQYRKKFFPSCRTESCPNFDLPLDLAPSAYRSAGRTARGDQRHQCKICKATFSHGSPTRRHKKTDRTGDILLSLVNKVPISRIRETLGVTYGHIYNKIEFLEEQCLKFAARREERLADCFQASDPSFATDAQVILVNWPVKRRRGTIPLLHMATVHQGSQFVVAATVDYDPSVSPGRLDEEMIRSGDFALPRSMRQQARLWSAREYESGLMRMNRAIFSEDDLAVGGQWRLPGTGSRVRTDIFMHAHMMLVKKLLGQDFDRALFCLDAEAGLAAATSAIFQPEVAERRVDIAEVSFTKGMTNDLRNEYADRGRKARRELLEEHQAAVADTVARHDVPELQALVAAVLEDRLGELDPAARGDLLMREGLRWPFHTKAEPEKAIRLRTDLGQHGFLELADVLCLSSIHPVDAYFNFARRRVAGFERGIPTSANAGRIWHAYSFYEPAMVPRVANILRFYHNYMLPASDRSGATPAMKIGLARGLVYRRDLLAA